VERNSEPSHRPNQISATTLSRLNCVCVKKHDRLVQGKNRIREQSRFCILPRFLVRTRIRSQALFYFMLIRFAPNDTTGCMWLVPGGCRGLTVSGRPPWECGDGYIEKQIRPSKLADALDQRRGAFHEARS